MKQLEKYNYNWRINISNVFGFPDFLNSLLSIIQHEASLQVEGNLGPENLREKINISKEVKCYEGWTIEKCFAELLKPNFESFHVVNIEYYLVLKYLQLCLFSLYEKCKHKNILVLSKYKEQYDAFLKSYLFLKIDTDEYDFIKDELVICDDLITELDKPVYNLIGICDVLDEPCEFKEYLIHSIDKRKKFLKQKNDEIELRETRAINFNKVVGALPPKIKANIPQQPLSVRESGKPEINETLILFNSAEVIEKIYDELKGCFKGNEAELKRALKGEQLETKILFPNNQNKFVEVFSRLKYNNYLVSTPKLINEWIRLNFSYQSQKGGRIEVREFNKNTIHDILTKCKGEPTINERICVPDWLPYKTYSVRKQEKK